MRTRWRAAIAIVAACGASGAYSACDARYQETCFVSSDVSVVDTATLEPKDAALGTLSLLDLGDGTTLASWTRMRTQVGDAGTDSGTDAGTAALGASASAAIPVEVASVIVTGAKYSAERHVAAPSSLQARAASTAAIDAEWTSHGAVWSWIDLEGHTDPDGTQRSSAKLSIELVADNGTEGALLVPQETNCADCALSVSTAPLGDTLLLLVTVAAGSTATPPIAPPVTYVMIVAPDGSSVVTRAVPGLEPTPAAASEGGAVADEGFASLSQPASIAADGGHVFLFTAKGTWLVDASFAVQAGPVPGLLGGGDIEWDTARSDVMLLATDPSTTGAITGEPALVFSRFASDGTQTMAPARVSDGLAALGVAFDGAIYGALFSASGGTFLARVKTDGTKIGADFQVDHGGLTGGQHVFRAPARDAFADVYVHNTHIMTRSVLCAD